MIVSDDLMTDDVNAAAALEEMIGHYNDAWSAQDIDAILALHAPGMVFENHTAGELAEGDAVGPHITAIFAGWPDLRFDTRRLYARDGLVVQEWTAHATHTKPLSRGDIVAEPTGNALSWIGMDVIPCEGGRVARKDVYSDSVGILRQVGLL